MPGVVVAEVADVVDFAVDFVDAAAFPVGSVADFAGFPSAVAASVVGFAADVAAFPVDSVAAFAGFAASADSGFADFDFAESENHFGFCYDQNHVIAANCY